MKDQDFIENGYREDTNDTLKKMFDCDRVWYKTVKSPKDYSRIVNLNNKTLYQILIKCYEEHPKYPGSGGYEISVRFHESPDGQYFWDCQLHGFNLKSDIPFDDIEKRIAEFYEKMGFIPDPHN